MKRNPTKPLTLKMVEAHLQRIPTTQSNYKGQGFQKAPTT